MLARRLPTILPPLSKAEAIDVARVHDVASGTGLSRTRPFRAPHPSITTAGLLGGARSRGELALAHNGVLFLDELSQFTRAVLEALRQPLEQPGFLLIAATGPCPCGRAGGSCSCRAAELARHRRRLSGSLLDRIELVADLDHQPDLTEPPLLSSAGGRERVAQARERQAARNGGATLNARLPLPALLRCTRLDERGEELLRPARERGALSPRAEHSALRVARTIADLAGHTRVTATDLAAALALRPPAVGS
jgi:magnesium chelatase family protein